MRALLDVNVLIALLDPDHIHHRRATAWLSREISHGWASCPITQNGCLRIMSQPAYPNSYPVAMVAAHLREATAHPAHQFWPDDTSLLEIEDFDWNRVTGHRQTTDVYLLWLAVRNNGRFVTLDERISTAIIPSARPENLVIVSAK